MVSNYPAPSNTPSQKMVMSLILSQGLITTELALKHFNLGCDMLIGKGFYRL